MTISTHPETEINSKGKHTLKKRTRIINNIKWHNKTNYIITLIIAQETQTNRTRYKDKEIT